MEKRCLRLLWEAPMLLCPPAYLMDCFNSGYNIAPGTGWVVAPPPLH